MKRIFLLVTLLSACLMAPSCSDKDDEIGTGTEEGGGSGGNEGGGGDEGDTFDLDVTPAVGETNAFVDTYLEIAFERTPTLGASGVIAIYKADGTLVDEINLEDVGVGNKVSGNIPYTSTKIDMVGVPTDINGNRVRAVFYNPVEVIGNTVRIKPHYGVLEYGVEYYVTIDETVISGSSFSGVEAKEWNFKTRSSAPQGSTVTVGYSGTDFRTIQAAIDYTYSLGKDAEAVIEVKNGEYKELLFARYKNNLTIRGESRDGVLIHYKNYDGMNGGTGGSISPIEFGGTISTSGGRSVFLVEACDMLVLENLTMNNLHTNKSGDGDQAEVIYNNSNTGRMIVRNCSMTSAQDTLCLKGYCWFYNCLIAGDVDFIWGGAKIALFEESEIRTVVDIRNGSPMANQTSYILQARCEGLTDKGFVFLNCDLTRESGVPDRSTYLARSGGNANQYDNITFVNCNMGEHISLAGWHNSPAQNPGAATVSSGWKEYKSRTLRGVVMDVSSRLAGSKQLSSYEVETYGWGDRQAIFAGNPYGLNWLTL